MPDGLAISNDLLTSDNTINGKSSFQDPSYGFCDLGGSYVCETQTRLLRLARQLGVETYQVFGQGQSVEHFLVNKYYIFLMRRCVSFNI